MKVKVERCRGGNTCYFRVTLPDYSRLLHYTDEEFKWKEHVSYVLDRLEYYGLTRKNVRFHHCN